MEGRMTSPLGVEPPDTTDILDTGAAGTAVIRGGFVRLVGFGAGVGLSVIGAAILLRYLGPHDFGRFTAALSLVTILGALAEAGMTTIGVREYSLIPPAERQQLTGGLLGLRVVSTALGVAVASGIAWAIGYDRQMIAGVALLGLGLLVLGVQNTWAVSLQSQLRLGWVTAVELVRQAVTVGAIALLVYFGSSLVALFGVPFVAALAALALTVPLVRGAVAFRPSFRGSNWTRLLKLTVPFAAANAVGAVYFYIAIVLLSVISTAEQTGYFGASFRVFLVLAMIPALLVSSAFPILARAARDDTTRLAYAVQRLSEILLLLGLGVALCTATGADLAIRVVAGSEFHPSADVLRIQALALFATFLLAVWGFALLSLSMYREILIANAAALVVSVALTLALAPAHGADGAALSTLFGELTLGVGYAFALFRKRRDLEPSFAIVPRAAGATVLAAAVLLVPGLSEELRLIAVALVFALAAWLLGAVPAEIGHALRPGRGK